MIKTILGIVVFTAIVPVFLSPFLSQLIEARGTAFFYLGQWMTYESMLGLSLFLAYIAFITLYKLFVH